MQIEEDTKRDIRITERLLSEYGFTVGCKGCEARLTGNGAKPRSHECRARLEEVMRAAVLDADVLHRRDARMRQSAHERQHTRRGGSHARENETDQTTASQTQNPENVQHEVVVEHAKGRQMRILLEMMEIKSTDTAITSTKIILQKTDDDVTSPDNQ